MLSQQVFVSVTQPYTINKPPDCDISMSSAAERKEKIIPLRDKFKYYKSRKPPPDFSEVIHPEDFAEGAESPFQKLPLISHTVGKVSPDLGLKPASEWRLYEVRQVPGLMILTNPFTDQGQLHWSLRSLRDYARNPPNKTNLDAQMPQKKLKLDQSTDASEDFRWFSSCQESEADPTARKKLLGKLRWATLGYHHNWDTKVYSDQDVSEFPKDLFDLTSNLASMIGLDGFRSEAAIVNFYTLESTLCGHTDHSEPNMEAPLFSISIGQSAIFLIGGSPADYESNPQPPEEVAMYLHSGDVVIMSGGSRGRYHAVPRIIQRSPEILKISRDPLSSDEQFALDYLRDHRININIRQVFK